MEQVLLTVKSEKREQKFNLDHAQRILDLEKANPPRTWSLSPDEKNYTIVNGVITPTSKVPEDDPDSGSSIEKN